VARLSRTGPQLSPRRAAGGASDRRATLPEACGYRRGQVLSESVHTFDAAADQLESSIRSAQQPRGRRQHLGHNFRRQRPKAVSVIIDDV